MVEDHFVVDGFVDGYNKWVFHGEGSSARNTPHPINDYEGDTFWREPNDEIGSTARLDEGDFRWSREDVAVDIVDIPCNAQHSEDTIVETLEEEEDVDETDWDWMEEDD
uniref:Uncharacterized protein n=1 Tax=Solanum tuberosum TaxID=4113 RepID=M1DT37_SOLTU